MTSADSSSIAPAPTAQAGSPELHCPICDYNLHGLPDPRCPECGFQFDWEDLLNDQPAYPDFFETARVHRVRAFVRTLLHSTLPARFWRKVHPALRPRPRRLAIYLMAATLLGLCASLVISGAPLYDYVQWSLTRRQFILSTYAHPRDTEEEVSALQFAQPFGSVQEYVDWAYPGPLSMQFWKRGFATLFGQAFLPAIIVSWPILTFLGLMIFRVSLLNARISPGHVLRCTVYSADIVAWLFPLLLVAIPTLVIIGAEHVLWSGYLPIALLVLLSARIVIAYQLYLKITRGLAMVISSQIMTALIFCKLALWLNGY